MKICLDPGHGGRDPGAVAEGIEEKSIVLAVSLLLDRELRSRGHAVIMTRRCDRSLSLSSRAAFANRYGAEIFISIHANAAASIAVEGIEVFHFPGSRRGHEIAESILAALIRTFPDHRDRGVKEAGFTVLRKTAMPAVLVELEFLTHAEQRRFLEALDSQEAMAAATAFGFDDRDIIGLCLN